MKNPRNLEELKARSEDFCSGNPELIKIARVANSPNAAYELALRERHSKEHAQACRYLAIIKRDYGMRIFNEALKEWKQKVKEVADVYYLSMFAQASARLHYIHTESKARLDESDLSYIKVVRRFLEHFEKLSDRKRKIILKGRSKYLEQVMELVELAEAGKFGSIGDCMLEKTSLLLWSFIKVLAPKSLSDFFQQLSFDRVHLLEAFILTREI